MKVFEQDKKDNHKKHIKVITPEDVCSDKYYGYYKKGVFYPGVGDIGSVIDLDTGKIIGKESIKRKTKKKK